MPAAAFRAVAADAVLGEGRGGRFEGLDRRYGADLVNDLQHRRHRLRRRLGLAGGRGPGAHQLHCQELEDAVLDVAEGVVVLLEDLGRPGDVEPFVASLGPGKLGHGLEEGADHLGLHALGSHPLEPGELAIDLLAHDLGQVERFELAAQLVEVLAGILAELALDRLELLPQEHLALAVAELLLDLRLDVLLGVEDRDLALNVEQHLADPLLHRQRLEQLLGRGGLEVEVPGHQVGEATRLLGLGEELLHRLLGHAGPAAELTGALAGLAVEGGEGRRLGVDRGHLLRRADGRHQVAVVLLVAHRDAAVGAVEQEPHAGRAALHRSDGRHRPHGVQQLGGHVLGVLALRDHEDRLVLGLERGLDGAQGPGTTGRDRRGDAGEQHRFPQGDHGNVQ